MSYSEFLKRTLTVAVVVLFFLGFWHLRNIFIITFLASLSALVLSIPVARLERLGLNHSLAVLTTLFGVLIVLLLFLLWIVPTLIVETVDLIVETPDNLTELAETYTDWRDDQDAATRDVLPDFDQIQENLERDLLEDGDALSTSEVAERFALPFAVGTLNLMTSLAFIVVVTMFLLIDPRDYLLGALYLVPYEHQERFLSILIEIQISLTAWMSALALSMSVTAVLVWVVLGVLVGVPNALAIAAIAALATIIPNIGVIIPVIPIAIFTLAAGQPAQFLVAVVAYIIIQQVEGNLITPSIIKAELNIPAALVFVFQLIAAVLFGALGVVLAVPLLAALITLVREVYVYDTLGLRNIHISIESDPNSDVGKVHLTRTRVGEEPVVSEVVRVTQVMDRLNPADHQQLADE